MYIPPKHHMPVLEDPVAYYYIPIFRSFFIKRMTLCLDLLPEGNILRLLDIGCGTGIILPELARRTKGEIWAVDNFLQEHSLKGMLKLEKLTVNLAAADLLKLPFASETFEVVLLISVLEHINELDFACKEIHRVLKPAGKVVAGFPTKNTITDKLLGGSTGFHVSTHRQILSAVKRKFTSVQVTSIPKFLPLDWSLYTACSAIKRQE